MLFFSLVVCGGIEACTHNLFCMEAAPKPISSIIATQKMDKENMDMVRKMIASMPEVLHIGDPRTGATLLMDAIRCEHIDMVKLILTAPNAAALIQDKDVQGNTVLQYADACENLDIFQLIVETHLRYNVKLS
jgi:hypothetical protein